MKDDWYFASHRLSLAHAAVERGYRVVIATNVQQHEDVLRQAGCEVIRLTWRGGRSLSYLRLLAEIVGVYRRIRPDVAHHVALAPIVLGSFAARFAGTKNLVHAIAGRGYVFTSRAFSARALRPLALVALRLSLRRPGTRTRIIVQNREDGAFVVGSGFAKSHEVVLIRGAGVDLSQFYPTEPPAGPPLILLASRLLWDKGVGEFVEAARELRREGLHACFAIVGGTEDAGKRWVSTEQLNRWQREGVVTWKGSRQDMPTVLAASHVVVLPSSYGEGVPKILLEAAASGRPIVTTDSPGCREVVRNGENGFLVPPRDSGALALAIRRLADDPALRQRMGAASRLRAESEFSIAGVISATLQIYESMTASLAIDEDA